MSAWDTDILFAATCEKGNLRTCDRPQVVNARFAAGFLPCRFDRPDICQESKTMLILYEERIVLVEGETS